jgi:hypothetical protein
MYRIRKYTLQKAKKYGVRVRPSSNKHKKIDVLDRNGHKIAAVGYNGMMDYPSYIQSRGLRYANTRRKLYYIRHSKDGKTKGSNGWWAKKLLWS